MWIMVGLVLFSSSVTLLLYLRQGKSKASTEQNIEVYVAAKDLKKGDMLDAKSITKAKLPKSYINFTPLTDSEIVSRYANVAIYKGEPIRAQKISATKCLKTQKPVQMVKKTATQVVTHKVQQVTEDTLSVSLSVFKNKDTLLKKGDYVDIVSVIPTSSKNKANSFNTKYIALHVKINNFISNGKATSTPITYNAKKQMIRADTVVLLMSPKDIKNFLAIYYKTQALNSNRVYNTSNYGGQLWMVKTPKQIDQKLQAEKKRLMVDRKISVKKYKKQQKRVKISYEK
jgi:hypothetical protein